MQCQVKFLSTLSLRRATRLGLLGWLRTLISIHALLAESDGKVSLVLPGLEISIHALLAESDVRGQRPSWGGCQFLSTLSLRRATHERCKFNRNNRNFYPRSPCGERHCDSSQKRHPLTISIHALLAESDTALLPTDGLFFLFLSTLSLRRATLGAGKSRNVC